MSIKNLEKEDFSKSYGELVREFYLAVAAMSDEEIAEIEEFNRQVQKDRQNQKETRAKRLEVLQLLAAIIKMKIPIEKRLLQDQIDKLNSM